MLAQVSDVLTANSLIPLLVDPSAAATLRPAEWNEILQRARPTGLLSSLHAVLERANQLALLPSQMVRHLEAARAVAEHESGVLRWEIYRIGRALEGIEAPIVMLKGAAYLLTDLPIALGRLSSDIDILVPKEVLGRVELALLDHGWEPTKLNDYDQFYYRKWSHELPPLIHRVRGNVIDVHHTILPPTGRLRPDPEKLLGSSVPLAGTIFSVLAPVDMVLHSAAHGFQDGDFKRPLRDLVDIDGLLRHFGEEKIFWHDLGARAEELDLTRPLFYAVRYAQRYLETPIEQELLERMKRWQPAWPALDIMDRIVDPVVTAGPWRHDLRLKLAQQWLYIRSHWLRMPPYLLIPHLLRKLMRPRKESDPE